MRRALVTGGTGFIGGRLAHALLDRGWEVTLLARSPSKAGGLLARGAALVHGDLAAPDGLADVMRGHDACFHLAAWYAFGVGDRARMERVNVEGTRAILQAAAEASVERIVYCSSVAALGGDPAGAVHDETKRHDGSFGSLYEETKWKAHEVARDAAAAGMPVSTVLPTAVYGAGDPSLMGTMIRLYAAGRLIAHPFMDTGISLVHVDDVAAGIVAAAERGRSGQDYILGGDNATIGEALRRASAVTGIRAPRFRVPLGLVRLTLPVVAKAMGLSTAQLREGMSTLTGSWMFSSAKAERELGYAFRSIEDGFAQTIREGTGLR